MQNPKLINVEQISSGWINKYILTYEKEDGKQFVYESASRKKLEQYKAALNNYGKTKEINADAICIVAITENDEVLLIREFRYPLNSWVIAFPAGLLEYGEDIKTCANRELSEETGYSIVPGTKLEVLPQAGFSSTGMSDETVQIVFARVQKTGKAHTEENELIEVFTLPRTQINEFLRTNTTPIGTRGQLALMLLAK